jgi:membrane-associated phospholipid phosphatase
LVLLSGVAAIAVIAPFDQRITDWVTTQPRRDAFNAAFGLVLGSSWFFYLIFIFGGYPNRRKLVTGFVVAIIGSALITHFAKQAIGRARPDAAMGHASFHTPAWFETQEMSQSFPSGHATTAAALAAILGVALPRWRLVFWAGAAAIGLERIVADRHFLSDVLAGGLVGVTSVVACMLTVGRDTFRLDTPRLDSRKRVRTASLLAIGVGWLLLIVLASLFDEVVTQRLTTAPLQDVLVGAVVLIGFVASICLLIALLSTFQNTGRLIGGYVAAIVVSTAVTHAIKFAVGRARPLLQRGAFDFAPFSLQPNTDSFISGHTGFAITFAILLGGYYPHARPYFLLVAAAITVERVVNSFHFATDLVGGVLVALVSVQLCRRLLGRAAYFPLPRHACP